MKRTLLLLGVACGLVQVLAAAAGVSKHAYLDLVEAAVGAYAPEHIRAYHERARREGIREHGFPRLVANLGVLVAHGRRAADRDLFRAMMDTCCEQLATAPDRARRSGASAYRVGNDFSVKEIVLCLLAVEKAKVYPAAVTAAWRAGLRRIVPETAYSCRPKPGASYASNWAVFGAASEQLRVFAGLGGDAAYVERYVSDQLRFFDVNGMYMDPHEPMVYDAVTRLQFMTALAYGYDGPSRAALEAQLLASAEPTLLMQAATGEIPYGGRSNQFLHGETFYAAVCEWYAAWFARRGDGARAARFRRAARRAVDALGPWLGRADVRHVKNRFPLATRQGCEDYAYFDKYMVTMGSWAWLACLFADESIPAAEEAPETFVFQTSPAFHRVFLRAGDYGVQLDTACDAAYDANGVGRIQRRGAPSALALSVPFPDGAKRRPNYETGFTNATPLAVLPGWRTPDGWAYAYEEPYAVRALETAGDHARAVVEVPRAGRAPLVWTLDLAPTGLVQTLVGAPGEEVALTLPAFAFDGETHASIRPSAHALDVVYGGWTSHAETTGALVDTHRLYGNRNGHARRFEARGASPLRVAHALAPTRAD